MDNRGKPGVEDQPKRLLRALHAVFGFRQFRPNQEEIIAAILAGRDVFSVMPTGGGKSLCYQLPATMLEGTAVVVSPLIALMKDQVDAARRNGIAAAFLNSSLGSRDKRDLLDEVRAGQVKLLYVAPERLAMADFQDDLRQVKLSLFAVDEAHCISEWGHEFRPEYLRLSVIRQRFPEVPLAAFTATATERVQQDIIERLNLREPLQVRASFDRPNLYLEVKAKSSVDRQLHEFIRGRAGQSGIVYRRTRASTEKTAEFLRSHKVKAQAYHAGLESAERSRVQDAFQRDEVDVVVATVAFGMGIDKPDIRFVVHADLPKNIESYYQEIGRAGRDSDAAHCLLLFSPGDIPLVQSLISDTPDDMQRQIGLEKLKTIIGYASHNSCRRRQILGYFSEELAEENCGACDICTGDVEQVDATRDAQILLSAVYRTQQRFGTNYVVDVVVGAATENVRRWGHDQIKTYGAGRHEPRGHWLHLAGELVTQEFITQQFAEGTRFPVLRLTAKGVELLKSERQVTILKAVAAKRDKEPLLKRKAVRAGAGVGAAGADEESQPYDSQLFERLRKLRKEIGDEEGIPAFMIFSNRTLREMSRKRPATNAELRRIYGVGEAKLEHYGSRFITAIIERAAEG